MIRFGYETVKESIEAGKEAAAYISTHFPPPIKLEFEKVTIYAISFQNVGWLRYILSLTRQKYFFKSCHIS